METPNHRAIFFSRNARLFQPRRDERRVGRVVVTGFLVSRALASDALAPRFARAGGEFSFSLVSAAASVWAFFFVPELKGRRFDEIDYMFQTKVPTRKMGEYNVPQ